VSDADPVMEIFPFAVPEDFGKNAIVSVTDCPAPSVFGSVRPLSV
jgi:hypothetical protein